MKPQFLFYFTNEPHRAALDDRARTARMLRAYRSKPDLYKLERTALNSYLLTVDGFADTVKIHSQEFIA
jgi:hypothetical protein